MLNRVMKQRVAVTLVCTVWLTSIVGASVPSRETTGFPNLRPSGPSSDQYTPLLRNPPNYERQDAHGRDWMSDPPHPRMSVRNEEDKSQSREFDSPPNYEFLNNRERHSDHPGKDRVTNDLKIDENDSELDSAEAQRLSSIKLAFDEPIDDTFDVIEGEEEDFGRDGMNEDRDMQRDEFLGDDTFEDEGPGSVEVYKLDLFKDAAVVSPRPARRHQNHQRTKSKTPKKVSWKSMTATVALKESEERKSSQKRMKHVEENPGASRSLKDRIFGTGGVPELQVGCEGVEGSQQRQKRSEVKKIVDNNGPPPVYSDIDYNLEDYYDLIGGPEDPRYSASSSRGDMNPKVKTPADIEARKILLKGQLPKRGDLGAAWEEILAHTDIASMKKDIRAKRSPKLNPEEENNGVINSRVNDKESKRRHRRRGRRYGRRRGKKVRKGGSRRRSGEELFKSKTEDRISLEKFERGEILPRNQPPNLESEKSRRIRDENDRKLADYIRRNTPIRPPENDFEKIRSNKVPADLILRDQIPGPDVYGSERSFLLEQRRRTTETINGTTFEEERKRLEQSTTIRPESGETRGRVAYKRRSQEEIERLKRLPVLSRIVIDMRNSSSVPGTVVESRFGNEVPDQSSSSPLVRGPSPCIWAIFNCCSNKKRLPACFEAKGCPGGYWDEACTAAKIYSATQIVNEYYGH